MKRKAILIGSPSEPHKKDFLSGVETDIVNMKNFLLSSIGGSWTEEEIKTFPPNEGYEKIVPYLDECNNSDFAFIYFSGHGFADKNNRSYAVFNQNSHVDVERLLAMRASRQITIIDACRSYPKFYNLTGVPILEQIEFPTQNPQFTRSVYDKHVLKNSDANVLLFATSVGKPSMDYGNDYGGLFSNTLLTAAKNKVNSGNSQVYNIAEVFKIAQINTFSKNDNQKPELFISNDMAVNLPFVIDPTNRNYRAGTFKDFINENKNELLLIGASAILIGVLIGSLNNNKR